MFTEQRAMFVKGLLSKGNDRNASDPVTAKKWAKDEELSTVKE